MSGAHVTGLCYRLMSWAHVIGSCHRLMSWALRGIYSHPAMYSHSPPFLPRLHEGLHHLAHNCVYHEVSVTGSCPCCELEFLSLVQSRFLVTGSCHACMSQVNVTGTWCCCFLPFQIHIYSCASLITPIQAICNTTTHTLPAPLQPPMAPPTHLYQNPCAPQSRHKQSL